MLDFDRALLAAARGTRIALVLCADHRNASMNERNGRAHFERLGADARALHIEHGENARAIDDVDADMVYIAGGSPLELLECVRDTPLRAQLLDAWARGVALAGSSAGAMALATHCLVPGPGDDKPTRWSSGMGPLENVGLAVHASGRPEEWLRKVSQGAPVPVLALDDATGVVLAHGDEPQFTGPGRARIVHAS